MVEIIHCAIMHSYYLFKNQVELTLFKEIPIHALTFEYYIFHISILFCN